MSPYLNSRERNQVANAMRFMPDKAKDAILGRNAAKFDERFSEAFDATDEAGGPDWRTRMDALKLYAAIAGYSGAQSTIVLALFGKLGVRNEDELLERWEAGARLLEAEGSEPDPARLCALALDTLKALAPGVQGAVESVRAWLATVSSAEVVPDPEGES